MSAALALSSTEMVALGVSRTRDDTEALVVRARAGDRRAQELLYRRHAPDVIRVATYLLGRTADVDDVVQDAFIKAFDKLDGLRDPASFGGWVGRIAANLSRSRLRRRGFLKRLGLDRGEEAFSLDELAGEGVTAEQRADLSRLSAALERLPSEERVAWTLRRVEGWPLLEIGESLGLSLATVKRRIADADKALERFTQGGRS